MTTLQTEFSESELLADHKIVEPLIAQGVRCHGGFDEQGNYVSPRTKFRVPAIEAWEEQRVEQFSTPIVDVPLDTWPENFPNVAQSKFLIRQGAPEPVITALTRIGTVEGFGAMLRILPTPDFSRCFEEDITGTAIAHIDHGLFEAHARDEAGFGDLAGHNRMWFVARDIAFDHPATDDLTARMLERMGIDPKPKTAAQVEQAQRAAMSNRVLPDDIEFTLETVVDRMIGLLLIEISAFHGFRWAEAVLADRDLVAGDGEAADLISYIRSDEISPRGLAPDRPLRDARPDLGGNWRPDLSRNRDDRSPVGAGHERLDRAPSSGEHQLLHGRDRAHVGWSLRPR